MIRKPALLLIAMSKTQHTTHERTSTDQLFNELDEAVSYGKKNLTGTTYEVTGDGSHTMTASNALFGHRQQINREVEVTDDNTIKVDVYNWELDEIVDTKEFKTIDGFIHWDVCTPWTEHVQPHSRREITEPEFSWFERLSEGEKAGMMRRVQKVTGNQAVSVSVMVHYLTGCYAVGHDPYAEETPENQDTVRFRFGQNVHADSIAHIVLSSTVYDEASIEDWGDTVEVEFSK